MVRRLLEQVEVKPVVDESGCHPSEFIWKGRLYVVRQVLSHWSERRAWWHEVGVADDLDAAGLGSSAEAASAPGAALERAAEERQVWRVEASPGWSFSSGIYDLAAVPVGAGGWSLVRVQD